MKISITTAICIATLAQLVEKASCGAIMDASRTEFESAVKAASDKALKDIGDKTEQVLNAISKNPATNDGGEEEATE